jgi:hypothetical protein
MMTSSETLLTVIASISVLANLISTFVAARKSKIEGKSLESKITETLEKVYGGIITKQGLRIDSLEKEITALLAVEGKWKASFYRLIVLIEKFSCKDKNCQIQKQVMQLLSQEENLK